MKAFMFVLWAVLGVGILLYTVNDPDKEVLPLYVMWMLSGLVVLFLSLWLEERKRHQHESKTSATAMRYLNASRSLAVVREYDPPLKPYLYEELEYAWVGTWQEFALKWPKEHPFQPGLSEDNRQISYRFLGFDADFGGVLMYETTAPGHSWRMKWDRYKLESENRKLKPIQQ